MKESLDYQENIVFFFGAGAEVCYNLPSGGEYTKQTMLTKRSKMYTALKEFYEKKTECPHYKIPTYIGRFLFHSSSNTFANIVLDAADEIADKIRYSGKCPDAQTAAFLNKLGVIVDSDDKQKREQRKKCVEEIYKDIISEEDCTEKGNYKDLIASFKYHGAVEQDFSALVNPEETESNKFWRLINYFWSAFFSILLPLLENDANYKVKLSKCTNKYRFVLENLFSVIEYLYSEEYINHYSENKGYYEQIRSNYGSVSVITTNYTPFAQNTLGIDDDNIAYLAGELRTIEKPQDNIIKRITADDNDFFFPYMLTQAYVKPIIGPYQLREYNKALKFLDGCDCLVVIGYSFCPNDNHICSIVNEYLQKNNKRMIYCQYVEKDCKRKTDADKQNDIDEVKRRLKLPESYAKDNITILYVGNDPSELVEDLKNEISVNEDAIAALSSRGYSRI